MKVCMGVLQKLQKFRVRVLMINRTSGNPRYGYECPTYLT